MTAASARDPVRHEPMRVERDAVAETWFRVGGRLERLARPRRVAEVARCLRRAPDARILGEGANLLIDDDGAPGLTLALDGGELGGFELVPDDGYVLAGAGAPLPKLISACVRAGLSGPERLAGIPATVGGAAAMNAGGSFGDFASMVRRVHVVRRRDAQPMVLERAQIPFDYRAGVPADYVVTLVELALTLEDPAALSARRAEVMAYKTDTQPMSERSAGCAFRNPTLTEDLPDIGARGQRVSAGLLIDRAGCKGLTIGGARVSDLHANFITTERSARARDVIELMGEVQRRVFDAFGVRLRREVVVWSRHAEHADPFAGGESGGRRA